MDSVDKMPVMDSVEVKLEDMDSGDMKRLMTLEVRYRSATLRT